MKAEVIYYTKELENAYEAIILVPGVTKEQLAVSVLNDVISIAIKENDFVEEGELKIYVGMSLTKDNIYSKLEAGILRVGMIKSEDLEVEIQVD